MNENDFLRDMRSHIAAYPEDKRVSEEEYRRRLDFCKNCEKLVDGMCVLCGCYVEDRYALCGYKQEVVKASNLCRRAMLGDIMQFIVHIPHG